MLSQLQKFITAASFLFFPIITFAQVPDMPSSAGFNLFTSDGDINNNNATIIVGHIGTNAGTINGFPPGIVVGETHIADSLTDLIRRELDSIYTLFNFVPCDSTLAAGLGNNQTLFPGVYCIPSAATIDGDLILDGQGDTDAVFVFKIDGGLDASAFSNVIITGLVDPSQIFWRINGAFELGDTAVFTGNLLGNGALTLLEGASVVGRVMTRLGDITLNRNLSILPVELISFTAACEGQNILVKWTTATEISNDHFSVEQSSDGLGWELAGTVVGAGNSNTITDYSFSISNPDRAVSFFRLSQTDFNGEKVYFNTVAARNCNMIEVEFALYPNPLKGTLNIVPSDKGVQPYSVTVYNMLGGIVFTSGEPSNTIDLSNQPEGIYFVSLNYLNAGTVTKKVLIEK